MIKQIQKVIGQPSAKGALNEIITAKNYADKKGKDFIFPPLLFSGLTGLGKTHLAERYAESFAEDGFQYITVPVKAGWRFFEQMAAKVCSIDGAIAEAIPSIILLDEAHEPSPIEEMIKLITGTKTPRMFERNGVQYFHDPAHHQWILASNEEIDPAQKRRCIEIPFETYDHGEKKQLITLMCDKEISAEALEYLESRTKPMAGDIDNLCKRLNLQPVERIDINLAREIIKRVGLFPDGLVKKDLVLLQRMAHDSRPTPIEALKAKIGDVKATATRGRLGWLQALELVEARRGGYGLTKKGENYLKNLAELQKTRKNRK